MDTPVMMMITKRDSVMNVESRILEMTYPILEAVKIGDNLNL